MVRSIIYIHIYTYIYTHIHILEKKIYDLIVKTVISAEHSVVSKMNAFCNGATYIKKLRLTPWAL